MSIVCEAIQGIRQLPQWLSQDASKRDMRLWTFGAWDGLRYSDNSRALYEYVLEHCPDIRAVWMTKSTAVFNRLQAEHRPVALCDSPEGRQIQRRSGYFFLTKGPLDSDPRLMHGCHLIWLWHGMPLKQIGRDAMSFQRRNTLWKRLKTAIRRLVVPWEFLGGETLSCAPFFTPFLQSAFGLPREQVWELGLPRNDQFFMSDVTEPLISRLHQQFDGATAVKIMLYMPTHRDAATRDGHPFDPFSMAGFRAEAVEQVLEAQNIVLLYKGHFFDATNRGASMKRILTVTDDDYDNLYTFIKDVDMLLTDYSSIYFDFLLCRKPIILFPFDEEDYVSLSRPFYFDYSLMEGRKVYSWPELADCLTESDYFVPSEATIRRFNAYVDGNSSARIVNKITECLNEH